MKYSILTFGCRTNQADSFDIERELRAGGAEAAPIESADVVVVNTCSVTTAAEQAARQAIRRVTRLNPAARVIATGCYAVRAPSELATLTGLEPSSTVIQAVGSGLSATARSPQAALLRDRTTPTPAAQGSNPVTLPVPGPGTGGRTLYLLRVQTGCEERCAYCIVPTTRGPSRSLPIPAVIDRVVAATTAGFQEMMITGVHLGCYGRDLRPSCSLADLLEALAKQPGDVRFRVSAVEPMDFDERVIAAIADPARFARHFHLPLQHASDRMLAAMKRPYSIEDYRAIVASLLEACPDAALGTDLIVGFPGETEADFQASVDYLKASRHAYVHVFPFSPRPGTAAAQMNGRPRGEDVRRRVQRLRTIAGELNLRFRQRFVGAVRNGLTIDDGTLVLTDNYLRVRIPPGLPRNERVRVKIVGDGEPLTGVVVVPG